MFLKRCEPVLGQKMDSKITISSAQKYLIFYVSLLFYQGQTLMNTVL